MVRRVLLPRIARGGVASPPSAGTMGAYGRFWSSTRVPDVPGLAWAVDMGTGEVFMANGAAKLFVRCV